MQALGSGWFSAEVQLIQVVEKFCGLSCGSESLVFLLAHGQFSLLKCQPNIQPGGLPTVGHLLHGKPLPQAFIYKYNKEQHLITFAYSSNYQQAILSNSSQGNYTEEGTEGKGHWIIALPQAPCTTVKTFPLGCGQRETFDLT